MLKKIFNNMYIFAAAIFFLFSCASFVFVKSVSVMIGGISIAILCLVFQYLFNVKWNGEARTHLLKASEELKSFGKSLPLAIIGKLSMVWIVLLVLTFVQPLATSLIPGMPAVIFIVISNVSFALFILSTFYQLLSGNFKGISLSTEIFAIYNLVDVIVSFIFESNTLSIKAMCLFIAFWSIHLIFKTMLSETNPNPEMVEKKEEVKEETKEETVSEATE